MAVVRTAARSLPVSGSVMAIAVTNSPVHIPGSQRRFCFSVARDRKYGRTTSLCRPNPAPALATPARDVSSEIIALNAKSSIPAPPYSSGTLIPKKPCSPAFNHSSRETMPSFSHWPIYGTISFSTKWRNVSRNMACSSVNILLFIEFSQQMCDELIGQQSELYQIISLPAGISQNRAVARRVKSGSQQPEVNNMIEYQQR